MTANIIMIIILVLIHKGNLFLRLKIFFLKIDDFGKAITLVFFAFFYSLKKGKFLPKPHLDDCKYHHNHYISINSQRQPFLHLQSFYEKLMILARL